MTFLEPWEHEILAQGWADDVQFPRITNRREKGMTDEERDARWEGASDDEKAFVHFLYALTGCKTVGDVSASAGALLQDLGYEPKEPHEG